VCTPSRIQFLHADQNSSTQLTIQSRRWVQTAAACRKLCRSKKKETKLWRNTGIVYYVTALQLGLGLPTYYDCTIRIMCRVWLDRKPTPRIVSKGKSCFFMYTPGKDTSSRGCTTSMSYTRICWQLTNDSKCHGTRTFCTLARLDCYLICVHVCGCLRKLKLKSSHLSVLVCGRVLVSRCSTVQICLLHFDHKVKYTVYPYLGRSRLCTL
jgi:hypothetical protein